jgi:DNA-binding beta-propeller fold protein YncE
LALAIPEANLGENMTARLAALSLAACLLSSAASAAAPGYHVSERIPGPDGSWDYIRVDPANNRVLVAHGASVMAVDLASKAVTSGLAPGQRLHDAMPVNEGREMLVTNGGAGTAVFADARSGATIATVQAGKNPDAGAFDAHSGLVLVMNHSGGDITLIEAKTHKVVGTVKVGGDLEAAAVDGAGHAFVNVEDKNQIAVVDLAARKVTRRYALSGCGGPTGLAYDAADGMLIAACDGSTAFVDAATGKVMLTLRTGEGADGVAFDPGRKLAFVSAGKAGTLAVIGVAKRRATLLETVPTQVGARTVAVDVRTGRVYLPVAKYVAATTPGGRPTTVAGTFQLLVMER